MQSKSALGWQSANWLVKCKHTMVAGVHVKLVMSFDSRGVFDMNNTHGFFSLFHTAKIHQRGT